MTSRKKNKVQQKEGGGFIKKVSSLFNLDTVMLWFCFLSLLILCPNCLHSWFSYDFSRKIIAHLEMKCATRLHTNSNHLSANLIFWISRTIYDSVFGRSAVWVTLSFSFQINLWAAKICTYSSAQPSMGKLICITSSNVKKQPIFRWEFQSQMHCHVQD